MTVTVELTTQEQEILGLNNVTTEEFINSIEAEFKAKLDAATKIAKEALIDNCSYDLLKTLLISGV